MLLGSLQGCGKGYLKLEGFLRVQDLRFAGRVSGGGVRLRVSTSAFGMYGH